MKKTTLILFLAFVFSTAAHAAVFIVPTDEEMIADSNAILLGLVETQEGVIDSNGDILTVSHLRVEQALKGSFAEGQLVPLHDLGGIVGTRVMGVSGGVQYTPGERVLVFLSRGGDGNLTTYGLSLGKMRSMRNAAGERIFLRDMQGSVGLGRDGHSAHIEIPRNEDLFVGFIRRTIAREQRDREPQRPRDTRTNANSRIEPDYFQREAAATEGLTAITNADFEQTTNSHYPPSAYTQGTFRWDIFDRGGSVTYYASGTQPGYDAIGAAQRALAAWTNDPSSNVNLVYGGTRTAGFVQDGINAIVFNSSTDVPSGAIGYAKWWANATHTYKGETFYSISEGDVVMRSGLSVSATAFEEAVTHEVGHTLGFRHSDQGTPASQDAVMRSLVSGRFGSSLGPWDRDAVSHVYGSGTVVTPPPCTPPTITSQPASTTITRGGSVTLSVAVSGTSPFTYQWYIGTAGNTASPLSGSNSPSITVSPTATSSYWVRITNACGTANSTTVTITVNEPTLPRSTTTRGDFNFDGRSDLIWRNRVSGAQRVWFMSNANVTGSAAFPSQTDLNWRLAGAGEFNNDNKQDLVFRNVSTGANEVWFMDGTIRLGTAALPSSGTDWYIASIMNYDRNGTSDIVWRNRVSPGTFLWLMSGTTLTSSTSLREPGPQYELIGTGDFNSDLWQDLVFRANDSGQVYVWFMSGTNLHSSTSMAVADPNLYAAGAILDADLDGYPDIVWRHRQSGANYIWYTRNGKLLTTGVLPTEGDLNWEIVGPR